MDLTPIAVLRSDLMFGDKWNRQKMLDLDGYAIDTFVRATLAEDFGEGGDLTSIATIPPTKLFSAAILTREPIVVAGMPIAAAFFEALDPGATVDVVAKEGQRLEAGSVLCFVYGKARAILGAERSALNTIQHLCAIATVTRKYVDVIADLDCILLDTRKTLPGLRTIEKYAVRAGGAQNHRMRLDDGILIKDNHIGVAGGVRQAVEAAKRAFSGVQIQVEVDHLNQIEEALAAGADRLLCDNMTVEMLREAVLIVAGRVPIEASGGVRLETIRAIAETGVNFVSVSRIIQAAGAVDIGLDFLK